jgi:hypothetical protein
LVSWIMDIWRERKKSLTLKQIASHNMWKNSTRHFYLNATFHFINTLSS